MKKKITELFLWLRENLIRGRGAIVRPVCAGGEVPQVASDERLQLMLDHMPAMIAYWGRDLRNVFANKVYKEWFGYTPAQMRGMHMRDVLGAALFSQNEIYIQGVLRGEPQQFERSITDHAGVKRYTLANYIPEMNDGQVQGFFVLITEVTGLKEAEARISKSEAKLQAMYDNLPFVAWMKDVDGRYLHANKTYLANANIAHLDQLLGKTDFDLWPEALASHYRETDLEVMRSRQKITLTEKSISQGVEHWTETTKSPVIDQSGNVDGTVGVSKDITERHRTEEELRLAASVYENSSEGMVVTNAENIIVAVNAAFTRITGYAADEIIGKTPADLSSGIHDRVFYQQILDALATHGYWHGEVVERKKNGELFTGLTTINLIPHSESKSYRHVAFISDVTDRKKTEDALRLSEARLIEAEHIAHFGGWEWEIATGRQVWSDETYRILGLTPGVDQPAHENFMRLLPEESQALIKQKIHATLNEYTPYLVDYSIIRRDGSRRYIQSRAEVHRDAQGVPLRMVGTHHDITDSYLASELLHLREEEFRLLVENSPDIVVRFDRQYRYLYVNPAIEISSDISASTFIGKTLGTLGMANPMTESSKRTIDAVLTDGVSRDHEFSFTVRGHERHYHARVVPERGKDGRVETVLVLVRDISEIKQAEFALSESRQMLRELAAEDEAMREQERKRIAREVHDELGQTLTALRMDVSLLRIRFGSHDAALMEKVQGMTELVDRAIQSVRNVATNLRPAALDMGVVSALEWLCDEFTEHTGVPCVLRSSAETFTLDEGRAVAIFRIVQESLTNVARYAEASHVDIAIERRGEDLSVVVRDNGKGFEQSTRTTRKSFGLLGMRERAIALGGDVDVISAPGQGTTISVLIPMNGDKRDD